MDNFNSSKGSIDTTNFMGPVSFDPQITNVMKGKIDSATILGPVAFDPQSSQITKGTTSCKMDSFE